jgi:hypothetical protein
MGHIDRQDVINVASSINMDVNDDHIQYVMENYESFSADDRTSNWSEVVECILYQVNR